MADDSVYDAGPPVSQPDFLAGFWGRLNDGQPLDLGGNSTASGRGGFAPETNARRNALVTAPPPRLNTDYQNMMPVGGGPEDGAPRWIPATAEQRAMMNPPQPNVGMNVPIPGTMGTQTNGPMLRPAPVNALAPDQPSPVAQGPAPQSELRVNPQPTPQLPQPPQAPGNAYQTGTVRPQAPQAPTFDQRWGAATSPQARLAQLPDHQQAAIQAPVTAYGPTGTPVARDAAPVEAERLGKIGTDQWPTGLASAHPGVIVAATNQAQRVANVKGYGEQLTGTVTVNGNTYRFINGGGGRGSIPFGEYSVGNFRTAETRERAGMAKLGDTFDLGNVYDPMARDTRTALRIHQARGSGTAGCIGLVGGSDTWKRFVRDMQVSKPSMLRFGPVGVASNQSE